MSYQENVYYHPDKSGLELIGVLDEAGLSYEYNTLIVLKHTESGRVFWASDSGCSCPTPFEEYVFKGPDDTNLVEVTLHYWSAFVASVLSWSISRYDNRQLVPLHERDNLIYEVRRSLKQSVSAQVATL